MPYPTHHQIVEETSKKKLEELRGEILPKSEVEKLRIEAAEAAEKASAAEEEDRAAVSRWIGMKIRRDELTRLAESCRFMLDATKLDASPQGQFWGIAKTVGQPDHVRFGAAAKIAAARGTISVLEEMLSESETELGEYCAKMEAFRQKHGIPQNA